MTVGPPLQTAQEMRAAEERAIASGTPVEALMDRAGVGAAEAIHRFAGPLSALVLCGPGNNGGDGYVIARVLKERGVDVRIAALASPSSDAARHACALWTGKVEALGEAAPAPLLIDALFGTGLSRPLDEDVAARLGLLAREARVRVAVDLPSGAATDDGRILSDVPFYDLTVTFATKKPSHLLQPSASRMGRIVVVDIGIEAKARAFEIAQPSLPAPRPNDYKYTRGYVALLEGDMPGAVSLAASAAARSGAGYVRIAGSAPLSGIPQSIVQGGETDGLLSDDRIGALVVGPGLGRSDRSRDLLHKAMNSGRRLVLDADALVLLGEDCSQLKGLNEQPILTPHAGEFKRLFGDLPGSKIEMTLEAARRSGGVVVFKGADSVVASPDGRAAVAPPAPHWLASAGTGDVLSGIVATMRSRGTDAFDAACAALWIHGEAAEQAGPGLIADDLIDTLPSVIARCSG